MQAKIKQRRFSLSRTAMFCDFQGLSSGVMKALCTSRFLRRLCVCAGLIALSWLLHVTGTCFLPNIKLTAVNKMKCSDEKNTVFVETQYEICFGPPSSIQLKHGPVVQSESSSCADVQKEVRVELSHTFRTSVMHKTMCSKHIEVTAATSSANQQSLSKGHRTALLDRGKQSVHIANISTYCQKAL